MLIMTDIIIDTHRGTIRRSSELSSISALEAVVKLSLRVQRPKSFSWRTCGHNGWYIPLYFYDEKNSIFY